MSDFFGEFSFDYEASTRRRAYRISIPGLYVRIRGLEHTFPVQDISATGIAFENTSKQDLKYQPGDELELDLLIKDRTYMEELKALLVRHRDFMLACEFNDLGLRQEAGLDKLVLEVQKKWIAAKKKKRAEEKNEKT